MASILGDFSTNLVEHWSLEETSGTRTGSYASKTLSDHNTVLYGTGIQGNGADFENDNSEYLQGTFSGVAHNDDITISAWVKLESWLSSNGFAGLVCMFHGNGTYWRESLVRLIRYNGSNYLDFMHANGGEAELQYVWSGLTTGTWYHIVATMDYGATNGLKLYINASNVATGNDSGATYATANKNIITIGADTDNAGTPYSGRYFDGIIDEVTIWNRVLSSTEITTLYNSGAGIPYSSGSTAFIPRISIS